MDEVFQPLLPYLLLLARVSALVAVLPIFSWQIAPMRVRVGLALVLTMFMAAMTPASALPRPVGWLAAGLLMAQETLTGLGLGLAVALVFSAVQQGARMAEVQMGLADAEIIDPVSAESAEPLSLIFEMTFALLFLVANGHHLLVRFMAASFEVWPVGSGPDLAALAGGVLESGALMLMLALKLAAPVLAAFLILATVLGILARIVPEMDILFSSLPLRVGLGLLMASAIMPALSGFIGELGGWMNRLMT